MFKPALVTADQFQKEVPPMDEAMVNKVFKVMHGSYGNLFLSKFATGVLDANKRDLGVASARKVWAYSLSSFSESTLMSALEQSLAKHGEFPPSLPQFVAFCKACAPRKTFQPQQPAIGMSQSLRSQYAARAREVIARHAKRSVDRRTGYVEVAPGLRGLFQAIAVAVGAAGGDEVRELQRFERLYPMVAA